MTLDEYIDSHASQQPEYLDRIERLTNLRLINGRMCSGHLQGRLLKMLVQMIRPSRVLELGTFSGFSACCIAEGMTPGGVIDTIEIDDELEEFILSNFALTPFPERFRLHIGEAERVARQWSTDEFDLIFMDADKRRYVEDLNIVLPLLKPGGYIIADNTLWDGHVVNPAKSRDPQTRGIMEFNDFVLNHPELESLILPLRDGLTLIRKKTKTDKSAFYN